MIAWNMDLAIKMPIDQKTHIGRKWPFLMYGKFLVLCFSYVFWKKHIAVYLEVFSQFQKMFERGLASFLSEGIRA